MVHVAVYSGERWEEEVEVPEDHLTLHPQERQVEAVSSDADLE